MNIKEINNIITEPFKSITKLRKEMLSLLAIYTENYTDEEISLLTVTTNVVALKECKPLSKILDAYAFIYRHKSLNEQLKFFLNINLAEEDRKELNYVRFILIGSAYCQTYLDIKEDIKEDELKKIMNKFNLSIPYYRFINLVDLLLMNKLNAKQIKAVEELFRKDVVHYCHKKSTTIMPQIIIILFLNLIEYCNHNKKYSNRNYMLLQTNFVLFPRLTCTLIPINVNNIKPKSPLNIHYLMTVYHYAILDDITKCILEDYEGSLSTISNDLDIYRAKQDLLYKRNVLLPKSGVLMLIHDDEFIESILLKEHHKGLLDYLVVKVVYKLPEKHVQTYLFPMKKDTICISVIYEMLVAGNSAGDLIDYIVDFYNIDITSDIAFQKSELKSYEVVAPIYWKYRNNNYMSPSESKQTKTGIKLQRQYEIEVSPYIRKGNPSRKQLDLAEELCIELKPGFTIANGYSRVNRKIK